MAEHIRTLQGFKSQTDPQIVATAGAVLQGMTGNTAFPSPPVDLKALQAGFDDLNAAIAAQAHGGIAATAQKNNRREELILLLRKLAHYVQDNCGNDLAVFLSSGFLAAATNRARSPLAKPSILSVDYGNTTQLVVKVSPIVRAKCYEVRLAALGAGGTPSPWQNAGLFTNSRSMTINDLTPGTTYAFQVRAVGGSTGYTDWSDPVAHMCP